MAGLSTCDCAAALAAIGRTARPNNFAGLGRPHFQSLSLAGNVATVTTSVSAPHDLIAHCSFSVIRENDGWKLDKAASLQFSPPS